MKVLCIEDVKVVHGRRDWYVAYHKGGVYDTHKLDASITNRLMADDDRGMRHAVDGDDMPGFFGRHFIMEG